MASKSSQDGLNPKLLMVILLVVGFVGGYLFARMKYKPQIAELTNKTIEKAKEATEVKKSANKVMMKDGKVWLVEKGIAEELDANIMFANGDKVMMDGSIERSDGTKEMMKDGQEMDMNGNMMDASM